MKPTPALIRHFRRPFSFLTTSVICATSALSPSASAATGTWSGAATGTWNTSATNWSGVSGTPWDVTNGPNNDAVFNTASLNATISGAVFTSGITFGTTGILGGSGSINLAGSSTLSVASGQTGTINSVVAGSGTLTKSGDGTAIIDAPNWNANTFSGAVVVNGGTLKIGSTNPSEGLYAASSYTVNPNATLISFANAPLSVSAACTLNGGTLKGSTTAGNQPIGALTLNNGATLEAGTGVNGSWQAFALYGTVTVTGTSKSSITTTGAGSSGVHLTPYGSADDTMRTFDVPDVTGNANEDLLITAPLLNSNGQLKRAGLIKTGTGTIKLAGANTYSGPTIINNGAIVVTGTLGSTSITVNSPGGLIAWHDSSLIHPITLNGGTISFSKDSCFSIWALTMNGGTVNGPNGLNSSWQSLVLDNDVVVGGSNASVIRTVGTTANGVHLVGHGSGGTKIRTFNVADATGNGDADLIVSAALINGAGDLAAAGMAKTGTGTMTLSGANAYTGATTVTLGTLALVGGSHTSPITVSGGASLGFTLGSPTTSTRSFNLSAGTIKITGTPTLTSYTLITSSSGITGTPTLDAPITGYALMVDGVSLKLVQAYTAWAAGYLPANVSDKAGNNDGDTLTNLQEFAFGTNPTVSYSGPILYDLDGNVTTPGSPVATNFAVGGGVDFRAVFGRRKDYVAAGLTYTVQFSAGLNVWVNSAATPTRLTGASSTGDIDAYSVPYPLFITTARGVEKPTFLRVAVTSN